MVDIYHIDCGGIAFRYEVTPDLNGYIRASMATMLDGSKPKEYTDVICSSCGNPVTSPARLTWDSKAK